MESNVDNININTDSEGGMRSAHQHSQSSQGMKDQNQRLNTIQQKNGSEKNIGRARSKDKMSANNLNTIQHPPQRKSSQPPLKGPKTSSKPNTIAAAAQMQNQMLQPKQHLNTKILNQKDHQRNKQGASNGVPPQADVQNSGPGSTQGQGQGLGTSSSQQMGRQQVSSMLNQANQKVQARGTTPLRLNKQNTQKASNQTQGGTTLIPSATNQGANQRGSSGQINQRKSQHANNQNKTKTSNNQQIKGIMAAALASVKANPGIQNQLNNQGAVLPAGIAKPIRNHEFEPQILNQGQNNSSLQDLAGQEEQNYLNFADTNDLMILKANSVNQKYMTELIQNQNIASDEMIDPINGQIISNTAGDAEYIDTEAEDDEGDAQNNQDFNTLGIQKLTSSPLRQPKPTKKSEERKVFSQQDFQEDFNYGYDNNGYMQELNEVNNIGKQSKNQPGAGRQRGRSIQTAQQRPQTTNVKGNYSIDRNLANNNHQNSINGVKMVHNKVEPVALYNAKTSNTTQKPKNNVISPQGQMPFEFDPNHQILNHEVNLLQYQSGNRENDIKRVIDKNTDEVQNMKMQNQKLEVSQSRLSQRLDIFEEEIIKRVREIQKYSKGLNSLLRKNVMPDVAIVIEKVAKLEVKEPEAPSQVVMGDQNQDLYKQFDQKINQLQMQIAQQESTIQNMQINIETDINNKFNLVDQRLLNISNQTPASDRGENVEIQQKLVEQNQLLSMLDEQANSQEQQIQSIQTQLNEKDEIIVELSEVVSNLNSKSDYKPASDDKMDGNNTNDNTAIMDNVNAFYNNITQTIDSVMDKFKDMETNLNKQQEDSEGRDGLMLKHNEDITNLFQTSEQVLENQKSIKEHIENMEITHQQVQKDMESLSQEAVSSEQVNNLMNQVQQQLSDQIQQLNIPNNDQSQEVNEQISALEEAFEKKIGDLRQNQEGRLKLCIDQQQEELMQTLQKQAQNSQYQIEQIQIEIENMVANSDKKLTESIDQMNFNFQNISELNQSLELQLQAQIDEQNATQDTRMKKLEQKLNEPSTLPEEVKNGQSMQKEDLEAVTSELASMSNMIEQVQDRIDKVESKDVFTIIEDQSINPIRREIEDMHVHITQKNQELNENQHSQINQLIHEVKQIQDNFEDLQNIVVAASRDIQVLQEDNGGNTNQNEMNQITDAITQVKLDVEQFKETFENQIKSMQEFQANDNQKQLSLIQKNRDDITSIVQGLELDIKTVKNSVENDMKTVKSSFENVKSGIDTNQEPVETSQEIQRLERQLEEIEIQIKNIYQQNTQEFDEMKQYKVSIHEFQESVKQNQDKISSHIESIQQELTDRINAHIQKTEQDLLSNQQSWANSDNVVDDKVIAVVQKQIHEIQEEIKMVQEGKKSSNNNAVDDQAIVTLQKQIDDLVESLSIVKQSCQIIAQMMPQIEAIKNDKVRISQRLDELQELSQNPPSSNNEDLKSEIKKQISELKNERIREEKALSAKIDLNAMDIKTCSGYQKQMEFLKSEFNDIQARIQTIETQYSDVQAMKQIVDIMQDSNFGAQIDEVRKQINSNRHSMPQMHTTLQTQSQNNIETQEFSLQVSKKKKVEPVKSVNPNLVKKVTAPVDSSKDEVIISQKSVEESAEVQDEIKILKSEKPDIDLSSINSKEKNKIDQANNNIFSGTDQDLKNNLKHLFQDEHDGTSRPSDIQFQDETKNANRLSQIQVDNFMKTEEDMKQEPFENKEESADDIEDDYEDDFDDIEDEDINRRESKMDTSNHSDQEKPDHEQLYEQEVKLPILEQDNTDNTNSFKNSSKVENITQEVAAKESSISDSKDEPISIGSIHLEQNDKEMTLDEQNKMTEQIMEHFDFDLIVAENIDEIINQIIDKQSVQPDQENSSDDLQDLQQQDQDKFELY